VDVIVWVIVVAGFVTVVVVDAVLVVASVVVAVDVAVLVEVAVSVVVPVVVFVVLGLRSKSPPKPSPIPTIPAAARAPLHFNTLLLETSDSVNFRLT
jgi:hypothetical protein